jgi:hypothetical protein
MFNCIGLMRITEFCPAPIQGPATVSVTPASVSRIGRHMGSRSEKASLQTYWPDTGINLNQIPLKRWQFTWADAAAVAVFAVFALGNFLARWKGIVPFIFLGSDAGIVSSFVAAFEHPDLFRHDVLLGNINNFRYYLAVHPVLIYALKKIVGDYGTAYIFLLPFITLAQAIGFYLLGMVLFRNRYWAFLLALITLCPIALPIRESWGAYHDPLPRSLFHAFLPYLLAAAFHFQDRRRAWPWIMVGCGFAFYIHPVSAPHWAFALWLGMWLFLPGQWSWGKKIGFMFGLGLVFVAMVLPWLANLVLVHEHALDTAVKYRDLVPIISARVGPELLNVGLALEMWKKQIFSWPMALYCSWALIASAAVAYLLPTMRKRVLLVAVWALGILFVAVGLTYAEQTICKTFGLSRFQMDSIRGIKYLVPLMLLLCIWPLAAISNVLPRRSFKRLGVMLVGALLLAGWAHYYPPNLFMKCLKSWVHGSIMPPVSPVEKEILAAVDSVHKYVPKGDRILPLTLALEIRYSALRPVVYSYKDGGIFADTNRAALLTWNKIKNEVRGITASICANNLSSGLRRLQSLSRSLGAEYTIVNCKISPDVARTNGWDIIWSNPLYTLMRLRQSRKHAGIPPTSLSKTQE